MSKKKKPKKVKFKKMPTPVISPDELFQFHLMTRPGDWCPKCGYEQPSDGSCPECYALDEPDDGDAEAWSMEQLRYMMAGLLSPREIQAIDGMWRFM